MTAPAVRNVTAEAQVEKRPNAIPGLFTCRIQKGPTTWTDSPRPSCVTTICFVSWSAASAESATAASPSQWNGPAVSERSTMEIGTRPSVAEPTRTSISRGDGLTNPSLRGACSRYTYSRTGSRRVGPRRSVCRSARMSRRSRFDPPQRLVDRGQHVPGVLLERVVDLAIERGRRRVGEMVVVVGLLLGLFLQRAFHVEVLDRGRNELALVQ